MKKERVIILGAGGQGLAVLDILELNSKFEVIGFLDNNINLHNRVLGTKMVIGNMSYLENYKLTFDKAFIAIGDNLARKEYYNQLKEKGIPLVNAIHPKAIISPQAFIGEGVYIGAGSVIGPNVKISNNIIINCNSTIPHNNIIHDHVNICPGVHLGGGTTIGEGTFIGIGSSLVQYINIGNFSMIGAGSVVLCNLPDGVLAMGVPAKIKSQILTS